MNPAIPADFRSAVRRMSPQMRSMLAPAVTFDADRLSCQPINRAKLIEARQSLADALALVNYAANALEL